MNTQIELKRYLFMVLGAAAYAASLAFFLVPNRIITGGISGISILIYLFTGIKTGTISILLNFPILLLAYKKYGRTFIVRCFLTVFLIGQFTNLFSLLNFETDNMILAAFYAGILQGLGIGLFCKYMVSSGGTELLARLMQLLFSKFSIPQILFFIDGCVILIGSILLNNSENFLYALIVIFLSAKVSDFIITGITNDKLCFIITDKGEEISKLIFQNSKRGITLLNGTGMYLQEPKSILMTVVSKNQLPFLLATARKQDENVFIITSSTREVYGKGFQILN